MQICSPKLLAKRGLMDGILSLTTPVDGVGRWPRLQNNRGWRSPRNRWPYSIGASIATHVLFALALGILSAVRPFEPPTVRSIDVQIISQQRYRAATQLTAPATPKGTEPTLPPSPVVATPRPQPPISVSPVVPPKTEPGDGMIRPSHFLTGGLLKEAASREVRDTLPKLAPEERITQLCNIETTEQIRTAYPKTFPDAVSASAFAETIVTGKNLEAPAAAYRSKRHWFAVSFICTVAPNYQSVTDYRFKVGGEIPKSEWDSHNLLEEDDDE